MWEQAIQVTSAQSLKSWLCPACLSFLSPQGLLHTLAKEGDVERATDNPQCSCKVSGKQIFTVLHWRFLNFRVHQKHPEGLVKQRLRGPILRVSHSVGLRLCISNNFPGDTDAAVQEPHAENHCSKPPRFGGTIVTATELSLCWLRLLTEQDKRVLYGYRERTTQAEGTSELSNQADWS